MYIINIIITIIPIKRTKLEKRGRLKIKHVIDIMDFAKIKYDKGLVPETYWTLKSGINFLFLLITTVTINNIVTRALD